MEKNYEKGGRQLGGGVGRYVGGKKWSYAEDGVRMRGESSTKNKKGRESL